MKRVAEAIEILLNLGYTDFRLNKKSFSAMRPIGRAGKEEIYISIDHNDIDGDEYYEKEYFDLAVGRDGDVIEIVENPELDKKELEAVKLILDYLKNKGENK